jgi:hypothetical protein
MQKPVTNSRNALQNLLSQNTSKMSNSFIHSNMKAVNSFIRQTIKDNPEPFRGYQEISGQTVSLAAKKQ